MSKFNQILTIILLSILAISSVTVLANSEAIYRTSFWVQQVPTNKVDINTYQYENMTCVIAVGFSETKTSDKYVVNSRSYGSHPAISCIKNN